MKLLNILTPNPVFASEIAPIAASSIAVRYHKGVDPSLHRLISVVHFVAAVLA